MSNTYLALLDHGCSLEPIPESTTRPAILQKSMDEKNLQSERTFRPIQFSPTLFHSTMPFEEGSIDRQAISPLPSASTSVSAHGCTEDGVDFVTLFKKFCELADSIVKNIDNVSVLSGFESNIHEQILIKFSSFIDNQESSYLNLDDGSVCLEKKIQWHDPHGHEEGEILGNYLLIQIYSFDSIFFQLTQKEDLCEADLLEFKSIHLTFKDWHFLGPSFLEQPFFISHLTTGLVTTKSTLAAFHLARLLLFRYKQLLVTMMLIHKALKQPIEASVYKRFALAKLFGFKLNKEIQHFSPGIQLPDDFWNSCISFSNWLETKDEKKS